MMVFWYFFEHDWGKFSFGKKILQRESPTLMIKFFFICIYIYIDAYIYICVCVCVCVYIYMVFTTEGLFEVALK